MSDLNASIEQARIRQQQKRIQDEQTRQATREAETARRKQLDLDIARAKSWILVQRDLVMAKLRTIPSLHINQRTKDCDFEIVFADPKQGEHIIQNLGNYERPFESPNALICVIDKQLKARFTGIIKGQTYDLGYEAIETANSVVFLEQLFSHM